MPHRLPVGHLLGRNRAGILPEGQGAGLLAEALRRRVEEEAAPPARKD